jgi:N-acetyl-gamma-glutamyl-phosphate/LysW-gamma-L-alpha-aminoadipyl-6-phosphate reductase
MTTISIIGGSGYAGGELIRLLSFHPQVQLQQVTSRSHLGEYVYQVHPNMRKVSSLKYSDPQQLEPVDILFLALPHGEAQKQINAWAQKAGKIIDLSADFRLKDSALYEKWYGHAHSAPEWLHKFTYGLPEINRAAIQQADYVSGVGCNATASILALLPIMQSQLVDIANPIAIEIKVGSSEGGAEANAGSHHPERSGVIRTFSAFGHRHTAEVIQAFQVQKVWLTMTAVDLVRGVLATAHLQLKDSLTSKDLWKTYRTVAQENPFLRLVNEKRGIYRVPEPKVLAGSNYADIGFALDEESGHLVSMCAIDNLMKGASGTAVQCMNLMMGWDEMLGLEFPGLHPI